MVRPDDTLSLTGRRIIVTGAGRGLGRGMALAAAAAGADVVGIARSENELNETADLAESMAGLFTPMATDVSEVESLDAVVERIAAGGSIDGVVHAAGTQLRRDAIDISLEDWRSIVRIHLEAPFFLSTAIARRQLAARAPGSHVFVASLCTSIGIRRIAPYVAAKSGVMGIVRTLALEWGDAGIRVNALGPGYHETRMNREFLEIPTERRRVLSRIALGRLGTADDLGGGTVFLLSDASAYMTGQLLNIDGGWLAG